MKNLGLGLNNFNSFEMSKIVDWIDTKKDIILLLIILLLGLLFVFLIPPFQKPDENVHFLRAVALSDGQFTCISTHESENIFTIPKAYFNYISEMGTNRIAFRYEEKFMISSFGESEKKQPVSTELADFKGYCSLSFPAYIPTAVAVLFGELLGSISISFYLGRMLSFALFFTSLVWSYKKIQDSELRFVLIAFASIPMVLHQVSSIGYDAVTLTVIPLIFSIVVQYFEKKEMKKSDLVIYLVAMITLLVSKPGYYFLALIYFLIPKNEITRNNKNYAILTGLYLVVCISSALIFAKIYGNTGGYVGSTSIIPMEQLKLLMDPVFFIQLIRNTINSSFYFYLESFIGKFGWLDYGLPFTVHLIYIVSWIGLIYKIKNSQFMNMFYSKTLFLGLILFLTIGFIFGSIYLTWNTVGNTVITGVQGRYFLLLFPFLVLFISGLLHILERKKVGMYILMLLVIIYVLLEITFSIYKRYYDYTLIEYNQDSIAEIHQNLNNPISTV